MGSKGGQLFRSQDDPNEVVILLEVSDLAKAKAFAASPDLREVMAKAGCATNPTSIT
jgi:hypothetical protein